MDDTDFAEVFMYYDPLHRYDVFFSGEYIIKVRETQEGNELEVIIDGEELDRLRENMILEGGVEKVILNGEQDSFAIGRFNERIDDDFIQYFTIPKGLAEDIKTEHLRYHAAEEIVNDVYEQLEYYNNDDDNDNNDQDDNDYNPPPHPNKNIETENETPTKTAFPLKNRIDSFSDRYWKHAPKRKKG